LTTSALAMAIYKERLNLANKIGISIAVVGIVLLSYQEIFRHLF